MTMLLDGKDHSELRVCCFYSELRPETKATVEQEAPEAEFVDTSGSEFAYWHELSARWNTGADLMVVEQDVELVKGVVGSFNSCPGQWCTYEYWVESSAYTGWFGEGLGCTRYRRALMHHLPALKISDPYRHWNQIDMRVARSLKLRGYFPHIHGRVTHLHEYR